MKRLMETNIYDVSETMIIVGSCLSSVQSEGYKKLEAISNNIAYLALLIVIVLALFLSLIIITYKLSKSFKDEKQKEFQN